jgi:hypothetical protein
MMRIAQPYLACFAAPVRDPRLKRCKSSSQLIMSFMAPPALGSEAVRPGGHRYFAWWNEGW